MYLALLCRYAVQSEPMLGQVQPPLIQRQAKPPNLFLLSKALCSIQTGSQ